MSKIHHKPNPETSKKDVLPPPPATKSNKKCQIKNDRLLNIEVEGGSFNSGSDLVDKKTANIKIAIHLTVDVDMLNRVVLGGKISQTQLNNLIKFRK